MKPSEAFRRKSGRTGLYNIMPISNMSSVLINGILSNEEAGRIFHTSVAMTEIQLKRENVQIPNGLKQHDYANLYFDARNPLNVQRCLFRTEFLLIILSRQL